MHLLTSTAAADLTIECHLVRAVMPRMLGGSCRDVRRGLIGRVSSLLTDWFARQPCRNEILSLPSVLMFRFPSSSDHSSWRHKDPGELLEARRVLCTQAIRACFLGRSATRETRFEGGTRVAFPCPAGSPRLLCCNNQNPRHRAISGQQRADGVSP